MTTGDGFGKLREVLNYDQDSRIGVISGADFHVIVLHQFVEITALDIFEVKTYVPWFVSNLLTSETLADNFAHCAAYARPYVTFLYARHDFTDALVAHGIMRTERGFHVDTVEALQTYRVARAGDAVEAGTLQRGHHLGSKTVTLSFVLK